MRTRSRLTGKLSRPFWRVALLLALSAALVVVVDWIAWFASGWVAGHDGAWGGDRLGESPWGRVVSSNNGIQLDSRDLLIRINGDQLTARYTATVPSSSALARAATTDDSSSSGNNLVDSVLGEVQVAEFHYGLTGDEYSYDGLYFDEPRLAVKGKTATVTVESEPFRLYLSRQRLTVYRPLDVTVSGADDVDIEAPGIQVAETSGATIQQLRGNGTTLLANSSKIAVEVWGDGADRGWLTGLRALGEATIPVIGYALNIFHGEFVYLVLLWALSRAAVDAVASAATRTARRATLAIVGGLSAMAFLYTIVRICEILVSHHVFPDYIYAGPMGLLVTGPVVWLATSLRTWRRDGTKSTEAGCAAGESPEGGSVEGESPEPGSTKGSRRAATAACALAVLAVALCPAALPLLDIGASADIPVMILAATAAALVISIARLLFGGGVLPWLLSLPMMALTLAAVVGWPVIWYTYFDLHVNAWGKWIYLAFVAAAAIGLAAMFARVFWVVTRPYRQAWQWIAGATAAVGITVAILPNAINESGVLAPRATGLVPPNLFDFFLDLPSLLSWVLIVMAFLVAIGLRSATGARPALRLLAIPIILTLFYGANGWLYLPVERLLGLALVVWLLLPRRLASDGTASDEPPAAERPAVEPSAAANSAIEQWRNAEFVTGQRQALATSGTDALRDLLMKSGKGFDKGLAALSAGQAKLSRERNNYRRDARKANTDAFSRYWRPFSGRDARAGFIVGAILGIIPATVTVLTTQPPAVSGGYPVLFFLGGSAWFIGVWALLGCFIGYFQPLIHGENGVEKGGWMFIIKTVPVLAVGAIWDDGSDWAGLLVGLLETLVFLIVVAVIVDDMRVLHDAGLPLTDWSRVHNWRLVVTWSTAVVAAIGTALATFLSTAATDLSQQTVQAVTSQVSTSAGSGNVSSSGSSP